MGDGIEIRAGIELNRRFVFYFQLLHGFAGEALSKSNTEEICLALKALGNVGHPASIKHIKKCLPGYTASASDLPLNVQATAVMALKNIGMKDPKTVRKQSCLLCTDDNPTQVC